jgi:hypothetical protein
MEETAESNSFSRTIDAGFLDYQDDPFSNFGLYVSEQASQLLMLVCTQSVVCSSHNIQHQILFF